MEGSKALRAYFPALDGLRGVACIMVVSYHLFPTLHHYLFFGWMSMDIFFVLSGFLITDILMKTIGEPRYLRHFYARRLLRVFPLYYLALIIFLLVLPQVKGLVTSFDYFVDNQLYYWIFLQNWLLILHPPAAGQSVLNHLWSMAVEEQFYLLWPIIVAWVARPKRLLLLLIILLVCFSAFRFVLWMQQVEQLSYFSFFTFTRFDGILIGSMVGVLQKIDSRFIGRNTAVIVLSFAAFNFIFYFINLRFNDSFPYLGLLGFSTFSMLFGLLIYDIVNKQTPLLTKAFDIGVLKWLGRTSYGTYIFHWPVYLIFGPPLTSFFRSRFSTLPAELISSGLLALLSFFIGYLSFVLYEQHFLRLKKYFA